MDRGAWRGYSPWGHKELDMTERLTQRYSKFTSAYPLGGSRPYKKLLFIYYTMYNNCLLKVKVSVVHSCPTLCDPMDCSLAGSSVHGILQGRKLEWLAISFSRGSSWPRDWTWVSCIAGRFFYHLSHQGSPPSFLQGAGKWNTWKYKADNCIAIYWAFNYVCLYIARKWPTWGF